VLALTGIEKVADGADPAERRVLAVLAYLRA
jgi:hypothetical protein